MLKSLAYSGAGKPGREPICAIPDKRAGAPGAMLSLSCFYPVYLATSMNIFLYLLTVLIWGTTWIAITFQLGAVPAPVSIAYRFWLASFVLMAFLLVTRRPWWPPRQAWRYLMAQGVALF